MAHGVSVEVFQAALSAAMNAPDPRAERVSQAIARLGAGGADSKDIATAVLASALAERHA